MPVFYHCWAFCCLQFTAVTHNGAILCVSHGDYICTFFFYRPESIIAGLNTLIGTAKQFNKMVMQIYIYWHQQCMRIPINNVRF